MHTFLPTNSTNHQRLPSPVEEDLAKAKIWEESSEQQLNPVPEASQNRSTALAKGKGRWREGIDTGEDVELESTVTSYPPLAEEDEESRRVEENLKRWEQEERLRRKAARESTVLTRRSFLQRGTSLLWSKRKSVQAGAHRALNTSEVEDDVPLGEVGPSPCTSRATSPIPTTSGRARRSHSPDKNPFSSPEDNPNSNSIHKDSAVMDPSPEPLIVMTPKITSAPDSLDGRPAIIQASSSFSKSYPTPRPIDIPPPRTPPPRVMSSDSSRPPEPMVRDISQESSTKDNLEEPIQSRWWTDWLCGCTEGHDRGGDNQAGRTNPFE